MFCYCFYTKDINYCIQTPAIGLLILFALFLHQGQNGNHERINFLPGTEKMPSKRKSGIVIGVLVGLLVLMAVVAVLVWLFVCKYNNTTPLHYLTYNDLKYRQF